jgi:hypothetical protein
MGPCENLPRAERKQACVARPLFLDYQAVHRLTDPQGRFQFDLAWGAAFPRHA